MKVRGCQPWSAVVHNLTISKDRWWFEARSGGFAEGGKVGGGGGGGGGGDQKGKGKGTYAAQEIDITAVINSESH